VQDFNSVQWAFKPEVELMQPTYTPQVDVSGPLVDDLNVDQTLIANLKAGGITYVESLASLSAKEVMALAKIGPGELDTLYEAIGELYNGIWEETDPMHTTTTTTVFSNLILEAMTPYLQSMAKEIIEGSLEIFKTAAEEVIHSKGHTPVYKADTNKILRKKILVIGPRGGDASRLEQKYGKTAKLFLYNSDQSLHALREALPGADDVIVMTGHTTHAVTDMVKARYKKDIIPVHGGYTSVCTALDALTVG
jgi:hypothetical protein